MNAALEYNDRGCMLHSLDCPGAFGRGAARRTAIAALTADVGAWCRWAGRPVPPAPVKIAQEYCQPDLHIEDADGDILLDGEEKPMTAEEYQTLKALVLRSAADLGRLYASIPDPDAPLAPARETFYGEYPNTARKMFGHTSSVTDYYLGELGVNVGEMLPGCLAFRTAGLRALEEMPGFLTAPPVEGSFGEWWSLRKALRRFLWHDRIHARAMYRRASALWPGRVENPYCF